LLDLGNILNKGSAMGIGKFQVVGNLGSGANSSILQIRRNADSKHYALKVVPLDDEDDKKYFEQARHEFRVAQMLDHPNLLKAYALETPRDWLFRVRKVHLLLEYVNGKTLDTIPNLTLSRLVQVFEKIAAGMVHMHRRGVYHADLKPGNIILSRAGEVKIIDFGLAWIKGESKNRVQGTPEFMAPEQAKNSMVNERTDIYNLGATMYRMATWRNPPKSFSLEEGGIGMDAKTWRKILKPVSELNAQVPAELGELIHKCLDLDSTKRPERMSEIQGTLDHLVEELVKEPEDRLEMLEF
jgi:serine/threonine protein kinase